MPLINQRGTKIANNPQLQSVVKQFQKNNSPQARQQSIAHGKQQVSLLNQQVAGMKALNAQAQQYVGAMRQATRAAMSHRQAMGPGMGGGGGGRPGGGAGAAPSGPGARMQRGGSPGVMGRLGGGGGFLAAYAVGLIYNTVTSQFSSAIDQYAATLKTQRNAAGIIGRSRIDQLKNLGKSLGYGPAELLELVQPLSRAVGSKNPDAFPVGAAEALLSSQNQFGLDPNAGMEFMGSMRRGGNTGFENVNGMGVMKFRRVLAEGTASGLERTRVAEHMANVSKVMDAVGENISGRVDPSGISSILAQLGKLGPGFQGARGAGTFGAIQDAFTQASALKGSPDALALMLQDVGEFGGPGSRNSVFDAKRILSKGPFAEGGAGMKKAITGILKRFGNTEGGAFALEQLFNVPFDKAEKLLQFGAGGFGNQQEFEKLVKEAQPRDINQEILDEAKISAGIEAQQFENGKALAKTALETQAVITSLVTTALPLATSVLETIRDLLLNISAGIDNMGAGIDQVVDFVKEKLDFSTDSSAQSTALGNLFNDPNLSKQDKIVKGMRMVSEQEAKVAKQKQELMNPGFSILPGLAAEENKKQLRAEEAVLSDMKRQLAREKGLSGGVTVDSVARFQQLQKEAEADVAKRQADIATATAAKEAAVALNRAAQNTDRATGALKAVGDTLVNKTNADPAITHGGFNP